MGREWNSQHPPGHRISTFRWMSFSRIRYWKSPLLLNQLEIVFHETEAESYG